MNRALIISIPSAVTLEGTVIHRSGLITGGQSTGQGRQFEEHEVESKLLLFFD